MDLYTAQMARYRLAKERNIPYIDTTVKSGDKVFAPSWEIVSRHKAGTLDDRGYTEVYKHLMRESYGNNRSRWLEVARMPQVCFLCYCPACTLERKVFCHRYLLVDMFERVCLHEGIPFNYVGELTPGAIVQPQLPGLST